MAVRDPLRPPARADRVGAPARAADGAAAAAAAAGAADRAGLEAALGHRFRDPALLAEALTHPSATGRHGRRKRSYERLEFLGDRVLGLLVAHLLIERFPEDAEGALTHRQVALVQEGALAQVAERLGLGRWLEVARSEAEGGGRERPALLADCCEALIGALYLDGGLEAARGFVASEWEPFLAGVATPPRDPKMALQEWAQGRGLEPPAYRLLATDGPPHAPRFTVEAGLPGFPPAVGEGRSKRAAEREAARRLLDHVVVHGRDGRRG